MEMLLSNASIVDSFERLLIGIGISLPAAIWVLAMVRWMIDGDLVPMVGLFGIGLAFGVMSLAVWAPSPWVAGAVFVILLSSLATFSFAQSLLEQRAVRQIDLRVFENAYLSFGERPDNIAAHFGIAKAAHDYGLLGQAIAITQNALSGLDTEIDTVRNASLRDLFRKEEQDLKEWIRETNGKNVMIPVKCPRCQRINPPQAIVCVGCQAPYLLDLARDANVQSKVIVKICVAWMVAAGMILVAAVAGNNLPGSTAAVVSVGAFILGSCILFFMLRDKRLGQA